VVYDVKNLFSMRKAFWPLPVLVLIWPWGRWRSHFKFWDRESVPSRPRPAA